jgi:glycosyltransferase involved in cell wall biosynthesis
MRRILFVRNFRRATGGNVAVRDYFFHALADERLDARIYFAPGSRHAESDLWRELPAGRLVAEPDWRFFDFVFVNGKDWRLIPEGGTFRVIHLVQHLGYADDPELRGYLARPALRICLSRAARQSIESYAAGPVRVIPSGVDAGHFFEDEGARRRDSVLVWGGKAPDLAREIAERLAAGGVEVSVLDGWMDRADFASRLRAADVFVALPLAREGFFRPPLEAMACGCAVVCGDALGNREHCLPGVTCLQPRHGDAAEHADAVLRLLADDELRERLRREGRAHARRFDLAAERASFRAVFDELL